MDLKELHSFKMSDAVTFHDSLNTKLFRGQHLQPEVELQLKTIAQDFLQEMGIHDLDVRDITISGSNAAYSYTDHSDLDLHILVNMKDLPDDDIYHEFFKAKKDLYNDSHDITINGIPVELYIQDASEPVTSLGEYSIKDKKWLRLPTKRRANFDQTATKSKYIKLLDVIDTALQSNKISKVNKVLKKIKQYRQAGLDKGGEFSPENLAYKALRSRGYITKLYDLRDRLHSKHLSLDNMYANVDEDYDPNGIPPGPEFKPTMPAGTVKVDVSDTYDWYKLGQHISNLDGLGKHDFGQGPPSTIMAFGSEEAEHKYIDALKKTGLTTTDIDPVDPNQPKGMKRQKTDPTYNVNEAFDKPYKLLRWEKGDHGDVDAIARLDDNTFLSIMFTKGFSQETKEEAWSVEFYRNNSQEVTGEGDAQRVFATVLSAIQTFIKKYKPNKVFFAANKVDDTGHDSPSRARLYDSLVQRYAKSWGFKAFRADTGNKVMYELSRIKKDVAEASFDGIEISLEKENDEIMVTATANGKELGQVLFVEENGYLLPQDLEVDERYRGQGIASTMYNYVKSQGYKIRRSGQQTDAGAGFWSKHRPDQNVWEASGYIPSEKQKNDPRFSTALTVDVKPDSIKKNAKAFYWNTSRAGIPPTAKPSGKI
jgi:GNAT superfamily N-acetyltransferase